MVHVIEVNVKRGVYIGVAIVDCVLDPYQVYTTLSLNALKRVYHMSVVQKAAVRLVGTKVSIKHLVIVRLGVNRGSVIRNWAVSMHMDIKENVLLVQ